MRQPSFLLFIQSRLQPAFRQSGIQAKNSETARRGARTTFCKIAVQAEMAEHVKYRFCHLGSISHPQARVSSQRSEERRVGKEWRYRGWQCDRQEKQHGKHAP